MKRLLTLLSILLPMASASAGLHGADELASKLAIQELIAEYAFRWDSKRSADFAELFTDSPSWNAVLTANRLLALG